MKLFHDSDGCLADWDRHAIELLGVHPRTVGDEKFWQIANAEPEFWATMPLMSGALEYWAKIAHLNPTILTGAPKGNFEAAAAAKREWWLKHFGHRDVIVCLSKEKHTYMSAAGDLLLDDTPRILKRWSAAGGRAILFRDYAQCLRDLKTMGLL